MTDVVDDAQGVEELLGRVALSRIAVVEVPSRHVPFGMCVGCGDEIEKERQEAQPGACRCLECQEAVERRLRMSRKSA